MLLGAGDLLAELRGELAEDGRGVHADLLEHAAMQHAHHAAATRGAGVIRPLPRRALESPRGAVRQCGARRQIVLEPLEGGADAVTQLAEPGGRRLLVRGELLRLARRLRHLGHARSFPRTLLLAQFPLYIPCSNV
jgi:hypothetical protein